MNTKEYLSQAYRINLRIKSKLAQAESLRDISTKASTILSGMPSRTSRRVTRMEDVIIRLVDIESEIAADLEKLLDARQSIVEIIDRVSSPTHKTLLELRYLCFKDWFDIATEMNYGRQYIFTLHKQALKKVDSKS